MVTWALVALTALAPLATLDRDLRDRVQSARSPALEPVMRRATDWGRPFMITLGVVALFTGPAGRTVAGEALLALVPVNLTVEGLKWSVGRVRPDGDARRRNSSFPSSHAANAAAVAAVVTRRWRWAGLALVPLAALVSFSRMYLDRHWFTDITAGALIGVGLSLVTVHAWARFRRSKS